MVDHADKVDRRTHAVVRYSGARPCKHLYTNKASLYVTYVIRCVNSSQWRVSCMAAETDAWQFNLHTLYTQGCHFEWHNASRGLYDTCHFLLVVYGYWWCQYCMQVSVKTFLSMMWLAMMGYAVSKNRTFVTVPTNLVWYQQLMVCIIEIKTFTCSFAKCLKQRTSWGYPRGIHAGLVFSA